MEKTRGDGGDFIDRGQERSLVGLRWFVKAADLSHELQRRCANLLGIDWRIEVEESFDIPAHGA